MWSLANPTRFLELADRLIPWLAGLTFLLLGIGLYLSFFVAPPDYQQGETVKIMFVHVPSAWLAMFGYTLIAIASIGSLIWRHPLADVAAKTAAPIGATFCFVALVGFVNVPIIKFSVDWWNTLHQPASIFRTGGPTIDPALLTPLLVMAVGFTLLFVLLHLIAMRAEILRRRVHALRQVHVERAAAA